jgi:hypothetical protein
VTGDVSRWRVQALLRLDTPELTEDEFRSLLMTLNHVASGGDIVFGKLEELPVRLEVSHIDSRHVIQLEARLGAPTEADAWEEALRLLLICIGPLKTAGYTNVSMRSIQVEIHTG